MKDSRMEIRLSEDDKRMIRELAAKYRVTATEILLAGAKFLENNPAIAKAELASVVEAA